MARTPARLALTIGINAYPNAPLAGCVNDALDMGAVLADRGYRVVTLTDQQATRDSILDQLVDHVAALRYRDRLVVHYSGHGTKVPDHNADEDDGWDEAWVGQDMAPITDDDLSVMFDARAHGSRILVLSDSCFSGTVQRVGGFADAGGSTFDARRPRRRKSIPPGMVHDLFGQADRSLAPEPSRRVVSAGSDVLLMSGASATEYAYDAWFKVPSGQWRPNGAFTVAALTALGQHRPATYREWVDQIALPTTEYPQHPQLEGSSRQRRWPVLD